MTDAALVALVLGVSLLEVRRILVVPHTRCAMASASETEIQARVGERLGQDASWVSFGADHRPAAGAPCRRTPRAQPPADADRGRRRGLRLRRRHRAARRPGGVRHRSDPHTVTTTLPRTRPAARWSIAAAASTSGQVRSTTGTKPPSSASATSRARSAACSLPTKNRSLCRSSGETIEAASWRWMPPSHDAAGLAADDDQRAAGRQHPAQPADRAGAADVDHHVVRRLRAVLERAGRLPARGRPPARRRVRGRSRPWRSRTPRRPGHRRAGRAGRRSCRRHRRRRSPGPGRRGGPRRRRAPPASRSRRTAGWPRPPRSSTAQACGPTGRLS